MTKQPHNQIFKTAVFILAVIAVLMGNLSVCGSVVSPNHSILLSSENPEQQVTQNDTTDLVCPEDLSTYTDLNSCDALITSGLSISDPENSIISLNWRMTGATQDQSPTSGVNQLSSYVFNEGTTTITYRGRTRYNNPVFCSFTVTVSDNVPPRIETPYSDITVRTRSGECEAKVSWPEPVFVDNCIPSNRLSYTATHRPGEEFSLGTTEVVYSVTDGRNTRNYSFTITVVDREAPEVTAPDDVIVPCGKPVPDSYTSWNQFRDAGGMAFDNCEIDYSSFKYLRQRTSGIRCPYTVTRVYSISDVSGNATEVEHKIRVEGTETVFLKSGTATADDITYSGDGTYTFVPPAGVTTISVQVWGAGGGGGASTNTNKYAAGGGGGGGYSSNTSVSVVPGTSYTIVVGNGGIPGNSDGDGGDGEASTATFGGIVVSAGGGTRGLGSANGGTGGAGGTGDTNGSTGGDGEQNLSDANGGAGGNGANGGAGGAGGVGGSSPTAGESGTAPGGGGGGSGEKGLVGGRGADGQVIITYDCPSYEVTGISAPTPYCTGTSQSVTLTAAASSLPVGNYNVDYSISGTNTTSGTVSMTVSTAGQGTITIPALSNTGSSTISITSLSSGSGSAICSNSVSANQGITLYGTPSITTQPSSPASTCSGNGIQQLSVTASGGYNLVYTWRKDGVALTGSSVVSGEDSPTLTLTNPTTADAGNYDVVISSDCGSDVTSNAVPVSISAETQITGENLAGQTECLNGSFSPVSVTATGEGTVSYQWYSNTSASTSGASPVGTNSNSFTPPATSEGILYYYVEVTADCGTVTSSFSGPFEVTAPTSIDVENLSAQTKCLGDAFDPISITASGTGSLTYQWYRNTIASNSGGTAIGGATSNTYTPPSGTVGTLYYYVVVSGTCGTATSSVSGAHTVNAETKITTENLAGQIICDGSTFSAINVVASGTGAISYQWYSNTVANNTTGTPISGATSASYTPPSASVGTTYYYVEVTADCGSVTSSVSGAFTVNEVTQITAQSTDAQAVCNGQPFSPISVTASGTGTLNYQWYSNTTASTSGGTAVGTNSASYTPSSATPGILYYYVVVTSDCGSATSVVSGAFETRELATVNAGPATPAICQGGTTDPLGGSFGGNSTSGITWTSSVGGTFIPNANDPNARWTPPSNYNGTATLTISTSGLCATVNASKQVVVYEQPAIVVQPVDMTDCYTNQVDFNVTATGSGLSYVWMRKRPTDSDFAVITSADDHVDDSVNGTLTIDNIGVSSYHPDGTEYKVLVTNGNCEVESDVVTLSVNRITAVNGSESPANSTNVTLCYGSNFSYTVETNYPGNVVSYQWRKWVTPGLWQDISNTSVISGVNSATLSFTNATELESGDYQVRVVFDATSAADCNVRSDNFNRTLTFLPAVEPVINTADQTICEGTVPALLDASVSGGLGTAYTYQWQSSPDDATWSDIPGAISEDYQPPVLTSTTYYRLVVNDDGANSCGSGTSASVVVTVDPAPRAAAGGSQTICPNTTATVSGASASNYTLINWNHDGAGSLANGSTLTPTYTPDLSDAGSTVTLTMTVTGGGTCGTTDSTATYTVFVEDLPVATISYPNTDECTSAGNIPVTFSGTPGGTYSAAPVGLDIDPSTGEINTTTSSPGTYTVTYSMAATTTCNEEIATATIAINELPAAETGADGNICVGETVQLGTTAVPGNTYSWTSVPNDPSIDDPTLSNPTVSPSVTTVYTLIETNTVTGCVDSNTVTVTSSQPIDIIIDPVVESICSGEVTNISVTSNYIGTNFSWTPTLRQGSTTTGYIIGGGNTIADALINSSTTNIDTVRYDIIATAGTCVNETRYVDVAVYPTVPVPTITAAATVICQGETTTLTSSVATAYQWYLDGNPIASASGQTYDADSTGSYTVEVTDVNGCTAVSAPTDITVNPLPEASISGTTEVCENDAQPKIVFKGSGGTGPYTISYDIDGAAQAPVVTGLGDSVVVNAPTNAVGTYNYNLISVSDNSPTNCSQNVMGTATVTVNPLPTATISGDAEVCQDGALPTITFTGNNGTEPYTFTYNIDGGADQYISTTTGNTVTIDAPTDATGTFVYELTEVQDASSTACINSASGTATITVNELAVASISGDTAVCQGDIEPEITFNASGGTADYIFYYNINNGTAQSVSTTGGASTVTLNVPTSGVGSFTYILDSVRDASSTACVNAASGSVTVEVNEMPTATISGNTTVCQFDSPPVILFIGSGGELPYEFAYRINGGNLDYVSTNGGSSATVFVDTNIPDDYEYTLEWVKDGSSTSCQNTVSGSATVTVKEEPYVVITSTVSEVCQNDANPDITITGMGGKAPYTFVYTINNGAFQTVSSTALDSVVTISVPTNIADTFIYEVTSVSDGGASSCIVSISETYMIVVSPPPQATVEITDSVPCVGGTATVQITGTVGTPPFTYYLDGKLPNGTGTFSGLLAGTYDWYMKDISSCDSAFGTITIEDPEPLSFTVPTIIDVTCEGDTDGSIIISANGGTGAKTYTITPNVGSQSPAGTFTGLTAQDYTIEVSDANLCTYDTTITVGTVADTIPPTISGCPADIIFYTQDGDPTKCDQSVTWTPPTATDNCSDAANIITIPSHSPADVFGVDSTTLVTYIFEDEKGNRDTCSFTVTVLDNTPPKIPSAAGVLSDCEVTLDPPKTTDNCSTDSIIGTTTTVFPITTQGSHTVVWTFTDASGNVSTKNQSVLIDDNVAPVWTSNTLFLNGLNIGCTDDTSIYSTGIPEATDNCSPVSISHTDQIITTGGGCPGTYQIKRTWTAVDSSGNIRNDVQNIYVVDTDPPTVSCLDTTVANPDSIFDPYDLIGIDFSDECGIDTVFFVDEWYAFTNQGSAGFCPDTVWREYHVYDKCGKSTVCVQTIAVQSTDGCNVCQDDVPYRLADLDGAPDSTWVLDEKFLTREGACCLAVDGNGAWGCISFNVYLDEDAVGLWFDVRSPAPAGVEYYRVDCGEAIPLGQEICLVGGRFYTVTFCKPGEDKPIYTIQSISGAVTPDSLTTRADVDCFGELEVSGLEPGTVEWTVKYPSNADTLTKYLSSTTDTAVTFTPDSLTPALIVYEVCGQVAGYPECDGDTIWDCAEVIVNVLPPVDVNLDQDLTAICEDSIPPIEAEIPYEDPSLTYTFQWYNGPDGTGTLVGSGRTYQPPGLGTYSVVVTEVSSGVGCNQDLTNFNISPDTIGPILLVPPDTLFLECSSGSYDSEILLWLAEARAYDEADTTSSIQVHFENTDFTPACDLHHPVYFWAEDICGNQTWDSAYIVIEDHVPPVISPEASDAIADCYSPDPNSHPEYLAWLADYGGARATDDCAPDSALVWSADTATAVWTRVGSTDSITVTFTVMDDCGNIDETTATFLIVDTVPPTITCPPDAEEIAAADSCSKTPAAILDPSYSDDCSIPELTYERLLPDGSIDNGTGTVTGMSFPVGTTTVIYTVTDDANLTDSCSFIVTIVDTVPPIIECDLIDDVTETLAPDSCSKALTSLPIPNFYDNCWDNDSLTISYTITGATTGSGSGFVPVNTVFQTGTSTVTYLVSDPDGNSTTCSFNVTIVNTTPPELDCDDVNDVFETLSADSCSKTTVLPPAPTIAFTCWDEDSLTLSYTISGATTASDTGYVPANFEFNPGVSLVTYIISDPDGNSASCSFSVTIESVKPPELDCSGVYDVAETLSADSCSKTTVLPPVPDITFTCWDEDSLILSYTISGATTAADTGYVPANFEFNPGVSTVTYIVSDPDGNSASCSFTVTIESVKPPEIDCDGVYDVAETLSADSCSKTTVLPPVPNITFTCWDEDSLILSYTISGATTASDTGYVPTDFEFNPGVSTVTYIISDPDGNSASCSFTVTIESVKPPEIDCSGVYDVAETLSADSCSKTTVLPPVPNITFTCWDEDSLTLSYTISGATTASDTGYVPANFEFNPGVSTVTYIISDPDGNSASCSFTVTIESVKPPEIDCDGVYDVAETLSPDSCSKTTVLPPVPNITFTCWDEDSLILSYTITGATTASDTGYVPANFEFNPGVSTVTYIISDPDGNSASCSFTVTIESVKPPEIDCSGVYNVTETLSTDRCSKTTVLPPVPEITFTCWDEDSLTLSYFIESEFGDWEASGFDTVPGDLEFPVGVNTVTYTITDPDGHSVSCAFTVTILHVDIPWQVYTCPPNPANATVDSFSCDAPVTILPPTIEDHCVTANYTITHDSEFGTDSTDASGDYPIGVHTVTWTISDNSGNDTTCVQTFEVFDLLPVLVCPPSVEVPADFNQTYASGVVVGLPRYQDNCDSILTYTVLDPSGNLDSIFGDPSDINLLIGEHTYDIGVTTITYYFVDGNGNPVQCSFTVEVTGPPKIDCPNDTTLICEQLYDPGGAVLIEGIPPIEWTFTITDPDGSTGLTNTYTKNVFEDADPIGPYFFQYGTSRITWIAKNVSGADTCWHEITVIDTTPPDIISCAAPRDLEGCDESIITGPVFSLDTAISSYIEFSDATNQGDATDNCGIITVNYYDSSEGTCPAVVTRTWTLYDAVGNHSSCTQTITINDVIAPTLTCPPSLTAVCDTSEHPAYTTLSEFIAAGGDTADNCAIDTASFQLISETSDGNICPEVITRTYQISDICGNTTTCTQTITIDDDIAPTLTCPPSLTAVCELSELPAYTTLSEFIAAGGDTADNCAIDTASFQLISETSDGNICPEVITRTYQISDICGNTTTCTQTITIDDDIAPTLTCPPSLTAVCELSELPAYTTLSEFIAAGGDTADNCAIDTASFQLISETSDGNICPEVITRTYQILDICGNTTTCTQTITIDDDIAPQITSCPADINSIACDISGLDTLSGFAFSSTSQTITIAEFNAVGGIASDNCGILSLSYQDSQSGPCPIVVTRTFTVVDSCNNSATCIQTITLNTPNLTYTEGLDTTALACDYADQAELDAAFSAWVANVSNNIAFGGGCDPQIDVTTPGTAPVLCSGGTTTVTWTITDLCETQTFDASFIVTPPTALTYTEGLDTTALACDYADQAELDAAFSAWVANVSNNIAFGGGCDPQIDVTTPGTAPVLCSGGTTTVTWTITDLCETQTFDASFIVTPPTALTYTCPTDTIIPPCEEQSDIEAAYNAWVAGFTYSGGCSPTDNISSIPALPADAYDNGANLSFTYIVDDLCSSESCTSTFTVEPDTVPPTFTSAPIENCVDPLHWVVYDEDNPNPVVNHIDPNLTKDPSPDYYTFKAGDTSLDLTDLDDNCCDPSTLIINWRIDFSDVPDPLNEGNTISHGFISGTGQPSTYGSDIQMWGDGVYFTPVEHKITYWVEDCHGNISDEVEETITVTPRPQVIKEDYGND
ncbi:HYR domain-containing protein [Maribellus sediminis]|uniref:HYR domain-containing protein n=1 Tax=Maribellus sediminis TaxID=2696285 RepID=UPI001430FAC0|nr:HYR domain-containing protein [Maribellus sediminis]